jgi:putative membrane protein
LTGSPRPPWARYTRRVSARFLDDEARAAFARAIESIEGTTSMEVVVAVRRRSAGYFHANVIVGATVTFAALAAMLFAEQTFGLVAILVDPFLVGLASGGLVHWLPGVKRVLSPARLRRHHVLAAARATFLERGVHHTRDRTGALLYLSWLEQHAVLVIDSGLEHALPPETLARCEAELSAAMRSGGAGVARTLEELIEKVAPAIPRREDDINELPDAIHSDLARSSS